MIYAGSAKVDITPDGSVWMMDGMVRSVEAVPRRGYEVDTRAVCGDSEDIIVERHLSCCVRWVADVMVTRITQGMRRHWVEIVLVALMNVLYAASFFQRVAVPGTIFDQLQSEFALSVTGVVLLGSISLYVYGGLQLPAGLAIDRFGATRVIIVGGVILTLGSIMFPLSRSVSMLYAARSFVGLGASLVYLSVVKEVDNRFSDRDFPMALGVSGFIGYAGGLMGTFPFERSVRAIGWRGSLLWVGVGCGAAVVGVGMVRAKGSQSGLDSPESQPRSRT